MKMIEFSGNKVIIMCCSKCNLSCKHCYISYVGNRNPDELLDIVKNLKNKYKISLNGAEVLTNVEYLSSYKEIGQNYILSNGLAIYENPKIIDLLLEYGLSSISISYHFGIHNQLSLIPLEVLNDIFKLLKSRNFNYRLMTTITVQNYNMIDEMCDEAIKLGANGIYFTNFIRQGNGANLNDMNFILNEEQIKVFFRQLMLCREKYDIKRLLIERDAGFGKNLLSKHDNFRCPCINEQIVLTPDNNIYPCIFLAKKGYEIGKYIDGKLMIQEEFCNINKGNICYAKEICNDGKKLIKR